MRLPFFDREDELGRLRRLLARRQGGLGVLYGRRSCGKSRLIREALPGANSVYYVGDDREPALQRSACRKAANLPLAEGRHVRVALWAPSPRQVRGEDHASFGPRDVLRVLR
jgi:ATPase domain predominantly from Archaea